MEKSKTRIITPHREGCDSGYPWPEGYPLPDELTFGEIVRIMRVTASLSLRGLSEFVHASPATLSRMERNLPVDGETLARAIMWTGIDTKFMLFKYLDALANSPARAVVAGEDILRMLEAQS